MRIPSRALYQSKECIHTLERLQAGLVEGFLLDVNSMTTKDIAEAVGKTERSIQGWAKKAGERIASVGEKIASAGHGIPADYDLEETIAIIGHGMGKNAADLFRMSANTSEKPETRQLSGQDIALLIPSIVAETVRQLLPMLQITQPKQKALPIIPEVPVRKKIINVVNSWAAKKGRSDYESAFHGLYKNFGDRYGMDVEKRAANRHMKSIDYLEQEGKIEELYVCAVKLYGEAN